MSNTCSIIFLIPDIQYFHVIELLLFVQVSVNDVFSGATEVDKCALQSVLFITRYVIRLLYIKSYNARVVYFLAVRLAVISSI